MTGINMQKRTIIAAIPLVLVNIVAFAGQFGFIRDHIDWPLFGQIAFALSLESIALFLTYMAHEALMSEDSAYGLRILSYSFGAIIGIMNYSHYAGPGFKPTFEAVATGLMSVSSPFLWGIYSRRNSRDALKAKGLIESRAVKLGGLRWLFWTRESFGVFRAAVWSGENRPDVAIADYEAERERTPAAPLPQPERASLATARTKADAVKVALAELGATLAASEVAAWLSERGWDVTPAHVRKVRSEIARNGDETGATILALPSAGMNPG
jgi:hypothetical protein